MKSWVILCAALLLSACGSGSGSMQQASTEGVPGFKNGRAEHPLVKLGKPYTINGRTYYPEHDPHYEEEGIASWYGPGFHGESTANGERFDKMAMTAAHRTLPLPSIVQVTNLKNNKTVVVRVNDRGPFASDRIIDLSKRAAQELDMIGAGTAKVRVEYLPEASERYVAMLKSGYAPASISIESVMVASSDPATLPITTSENPPPPSGGWWNQLNPVASAQAAEPNSPANVQPVAVETTVTETLPPLDKAPPPESVPAWANTRPAASPPPPPSTSRSPFDVLRDDPKYGATVAPPPPPLYMPKDAPSGFAAAPVAGGYSVQLGVFGVKENADNLAAKFQDAANVSVEPVSANQGKTLYRVRLGPFLDQTAANEMLGRARSMGIKDAKVTH
jgi:rare lipoprotein A